LARQVLWVRIHCSSPKKKYTTKNYKKFILNQTWLSLASGYTWVREICAWGKVNILCLGIMTDWVLGIGLKNTSPFCAWGKVNIICLGIMTDWVLGIGLKNTSPFYIIAVRIVKGRDIQYN
jgi:hypothetical protein